MERLWKGWGVQISHPPLLPGKRWDLHLDQLHAVDLLLHSIRSCGAHWEMCLITKCYVYQQFFSMVVRPSQCMVLTSKSFWRPSVTSVCHLLWLHMSNCFWQLYAHCGQVALEWTLLMWRLWRLGQAFQHPDDELMLKATAAIRALSWCE